VPSRRLGASLGINSIPAKTCTYACTYCQVGRTTRMIRERQDFYAPEVIVRVVHNRLDRVLRAGGQVDYLAIVPDGEPTLDRNLGRLITLLKPLGRPVAVISNSSLLWRPDVRDDLALADWVSLKVDAVDVKTWRRIDRPCGGLDLARILEAVRAFRACFTGVLATETMLVRGVNDSLPCLERIAAFLHDLGPDRAFLSVPTRPPVVRGACGPDEATLNQAWQLFSSRLARVELLAAWEGDDFALAGEVEGELLGITAVHPMREEAVRALLERAKAPWERVERLVRQGLLVRTAYDGHTFYVRHLVRDFPEGADAQHEQTPSNSAPAPDVQRRGAIA